jgi:mono/diheme cytochrome c family protein
MLPAFRTAADPLPAQPFCAGRATALFAQRLAGLYLAFALMVDTDPWIRRAHANEGNDLESVVKEAQAYRKSYDGWRAVRQLDCARCHGADYRGSVGPSLIESAQTRSRSDFTRFILDGSPERGMPPYKSVARVVDNIDGVYAYFRGLAEGSIPAGQLTAPE